MNGNVIKILGILLILAGPVYAKTPSKKLIENYVKSQYGQKAKQINWIIKKESNFKPNAVNGHCIGLMQINTKVWLSKNPKYNLIKLGIIKSRNDLFKYKQNIKAGVYILKFYGWNYRKYRGEK